MIKLAKEMNEMTLELSNGVFTELFTYKNHSVPKYKPRRRSHSLRTHIHTYKHGIYSWRRKCHGTDALLKMLPEPGICPHSARKTGWRWWRDISKLKESSYSPFCVANGSRKQIDKNDYVTLGLLLINVTSAWKTTSSRMIGGWRRHPSTPSLLHPPLTPHCLWGILQMRLACDLGQTGLMSPCHSQAPESAQGGSLSWF